MWLLLACLPGMCLASPAEFDARAVVSGLKREVPARTPYVEVRFSQMFSRPMVTRGELEYLGAGRLGKRVDEPYQETTTIADGEVTVQRGSRKPRRIELERVPELDGFLRGFSALLGGDVAALEEHFHIAGSADANHWRLEFAPRDARLARRIKAIAVDGQASAARCFSIIEADGDASIMLVEQQAALPLPEPLTRKRLEDACRQGSASR